LLRNPVKRAYSGFYEAEKTLVAAGIPQTAAAFDMYARIEVDLVRECNSMPTGDPDQDARRAIGFQPCCEKVARRYTSIRWPGCHCETKSPNSAVCTQFGYRGATMVRRGLYSHFLKLYLTYHRVEDLLIYCSEDFFKQPVEAAQEFACFARGPAAGCDTQLSENSNQNSATSGQEAMLPSTVKLLQEFYEPYNRELEELVGRPMRWW